MAAGSKRGGDMVLKGRHLVGIFFLLVIVLGLVFTLGYLLGRSEYDPQLRAAAGDFSVPFLARLAAHIPGRQPSSVVVDRPVEKAAPEKTVTPVRHKDADPVTPPASGWDFYRTAEPAKPEKLAPVKPAKLAPQPSRQAPAARNAPDAPDAPAAPVLPARSAPRAASSRPFNGPLIPPGATVLQVAALMRESDALAMAQALQQKKFPAFVLSPDADNFYRVQVGPYKDAALANAARKRLEDQGFKSIIKR